MKILQGMIYYFLILLLILLVAALLAPSPKTIERSIEIEAAPSVVFPLFTQFDLCEEWDPWYALDPEQERELHGEFGDSDYHLSWKSKHPKVFAGTAHTLGLERDRWAESEFRVDAGWLKWKLISRFDLQEEGRNTQLTWSMRSDRGFPYRILHYIMDRYLGGELESGLQKLKEVAEARKVKDGAEVELTSLHGVDYALVRGKVSFRKIDAFCAESYPRIFAHIREHGLEVHSAPRAMYYTWDTARKETEMATAVAISDPGEDGGDSVNIAVGEAELYSNRISYIMEGPYSQAKSVHGALADWVGQNGKTMLPPPMEEYIKGPYDQVDSSAYRTRIIYFFE